MNPQKIYSNWIAIQILSDSSKFDLYPKKLWDIQCERNPYKSYNFFVFSDVSE